MFGWLLNTKEGGGKNESQRRKRSQSEVFLIVMNFPVLVDLREGIGKGRKKKKSNAGYYPELFSPFLLHRDGSLPAPAVCSRLRDRAAKILTTELRL